jgi:hypothetical protein
MLHATATGHRRDAIGEDLSKDKPELNAAVKLVFDAAYRAKS